MRNAFMDDRDLSELKDVLMGFVKRVASEDMTHKTPEEIAILPGIVQALHSIIVSLETPRIDYTARGKTASEIERLNERCD